MSDFEIQKPDFQKEQSAKSGLNLSALAVRERSVTLFFLLRRDRCRSICILQAGSRRRPEPHDQGVHGDGGMARSNCEGDAGPGSGPARKADAGTHLLRSCGYAIRGRASPSSPFSCRTTHLLTLFRKSSIKGARRSRTKRPGCRRECCRPVLNDEYKDVVFAVYSLEAPGMPPRLLTREAETLRQDLLHVDGVEKVNIFGERPERIFVQFSNDRIATLGVSARDIFDALVRQNAVTPAGSIDTQSPQVYIRLDGAFNSLDKIRDTPITAGGRTLRLSDIADVERGYEDPPTFLVRHNGQPAMMLNVVMREGFNGLELGKSLEAEQKKIQASLPVGMTFEKVTDQSAIIKQAVGEFQQKFLVALLVVMIVGLVSLGWRVGIVVAAAVPITLSATLVIMLMTGKELDRITLGALILSLGLLVDDAIISIESIVVKMEEGWDRVKAATLRLGPHGRADACRNSGDGHRSDAYRFCAFRRGRVLRKSVLGRLLRSARIVGCCGYVHSLSRRQASPQYSSDGRWVRRDLRDAEIINDFGG